MPNKTEQFIYSKQTRFLNQIIHLNESVTIGDALFKIELVERFIIDNIKNGTYTANSKGAKNG